MIKRSALCSTFMQTQSGKTVFMNKTINSEVSLFFKSTRKFHRLQQTEFSTILGINQSSISKIEAGNMIPDLGLWLHFLNSFNIEDPYCFTYSGIEFDESAFLTLRSQGA